MYCFPVSLFALNPFDYYNIPGDVKWDEGRVSGAVYCGEKDLTDILTKVPET